MVHMVHYMNDNHKEMQFFLHFYCLCFHSILTHTSLPVGRPKMISEAPLWISIWCKHALERICPLMGMPSIWSRLLCIICRTQPNCVEDGIFPIGLRYVDVIWCVLHVLRLLPNLRLILHGGTCVALATLQWSTINNQLENQTTPYLWLSFLNYNI